VAEALLSHRALGSFCLRNSFPDVLLRAVKAQTPYSKEQSTVVALWVLARSTNDPKVRIHTAPTIITDLVNQLGDKHSSDSVLLHKHGYDRLFFERDIDKTITTLQRQIAKELYEAGVVSKVFESQ